MAMSPLDDRQIEGAVVRKYQEKYPTWTDVEVTRIVRDVFGGNLAVVRSARQDGSDNEELCIIDDYLNVKVFDTTEELVDFLQAAWQQRT